jgi:hypothetical protein
MTDCNKDKVEFSDKVTKIKSYSVSKLEGIACLTYDDFVNKINEFDKSRSDNYGGFVLTFVANNGNLVTNLNCLHIAYHDDKKNIDKVETNSVFTISKTAKRTDKSIPLEVALIGIQTILFSMHTARDVYIIQNQKNEDKDDEDHTQVINNTQINNMLHHVQCMAEIAFSFVNALSNKKNAEDKCKLTAISGNTSPPVK